ncbi:MAG TPA: ribonuclease HII [Blastocatellia bacterium]|nr:ribonuclease HII [Blastocatellia bacterium]
MPCDAKFEKELIADGYRFIAGADEVGRGAMAGPVVAAAVILNLDGVPEGIDDSKKLTRQKRERLAEEIRHLAIAFSIGRVEHSLIDQINIHRASLMAMGLAIKALNPPADYVLIDGRHRLPDLQCPQMAIVKGDSLSISVAAASILAKVERDQLMREYDERFPGYGFASHVGYNTREHQEAMLRLGPSAIHRLSFQGVLSYQAPLNFSDEQTPIESLPVSE